jgi:DNA polymerase III sliding clamp (beta) subunit (PCNA family)
MINRIELVEKLDRVAPALSSNNLVPVLSHFWFNKDVLTAYNDQIAISTKLNSGFVGAVPNTLIQLLSASRAKDVDFTYDDAGNLTVKAASAKFKLPYLTAKSFDIFEMPQPNVKNALPVDMGKFLEAIDSCTRSLKEDTSMPDSLGITLSLEAGNIHLYATNDATISYAHIKQINSRIELPLQRVVLSGNFCRQMLSIAKTGGSSHVEIHSDYSLFVCNNTILFGRLIDVQRPLDFDAVIESSFPQELHKNLVSIPTKLQLMLERAIIITESKTERSKTAISIKDGIAKFVSQSSEKGEVKDSVQLEAQHPDVSVTIDPRLFKQGYDGKFDKMLLTENCLVMTRGDSLYLVSASQ